MEKIESALRLVIAYTEAVNRRDLSGMMDLFNEECLFEPAFPGLTGIQINGKSATADYWKQFFTKNPTVVMKVEEVAGMGHRCFLRYSWEGLTTMAPGTDLRGADIFLEKNGLLTQCYSYSKRGSDE